ncbi:Protein SCAF11, partial [Stegodyphus mimosarum]
MNFSENFNEDVKPTNTAGPSTSRQEEPGSSAAPVNILDSIMAGQTLLHSKSDNIIIKTDGSLILKKDQAKDKANSWKLKSDENVTSRTPMSKALIKNGVMSDSKCSKSKNKSSFTNSESNSKSSSSIPHKSVSRLKKESQTKTNSSLKIKSSDSLYHKTKNSQDATKSSTLCGGDKSPKKDISRTSKMMNKKIKSENNSNNFSSSFFPSETSHSNVSDSLSVSSYSPKHEVNENLFKNKCVSNKIYTKRNTSTNDIKASISENSSVQYASDINCNSFATSIETELVNNENVTTPVKKEILSDDETNMDVWDCDSQFSNNSSGASDKIPSNQPIKTQIGSDDETDNESGPNYSEKPNNDDDKLKLLNRSITNVSDENGNENIISQKCSLNFSDDSEFEASLSLLEIPEVSQNSLSSIIKESISALHQNNKSCASSIEREHKVIKKEPLSSDDETDRSSGNDVFRNPNCVSRKMYQNEKIIKEKLLPSKDRNLRNVHKFTYDFEKSSLEHTISNFENSPDYVGNIYDINVECPPTQPVDKCISDVPRPLQDLSIKSHFKNQEFPATLIVENTEIASHVPSINVNSHCDSYIPKKGLYKSFFAKNGILPSTLQFPDCGLSPAQSVVQAVNEEHNPEYSEPPIMSDDNQDTELPATQVFPSIKELPATQLEESVIDNNKFKSDKLKNGSCIKSLDKKNDDKAPKLTVRENILAKIVNDKKLPQIGKLSANKLLRSTRNFINKEYQNPIQNNFSSNKDMLSTNLNSKTGGSDNQPCDENEMPATQLFNSDLLPNTQMIASSDDESNQNNKNKSQQRGAVSNSKCDARIEFLNDFDDIGEADLPETQILPFTQHFKVDKRSLINESNTNSNSIHFSSEESNNLDCTQIFSNQDGCEIDNNTGINSAVNVADMGITIDSECMLPAKQNGNDLLLNISKPALILSKHHLTNSFVPNTSESIETAVEPNHKSSEECESLSGQASNNNELQEQNSKFDKSDIENPPHKTGSGTEDEELTRDKINELLALSKKKKQPLAKVGVHKHLPQVILSVPAKTNIVPKPRKKNTFSFDQVVKKQQCVLDQSSLQSQQSKNLVFEGKELNDGINQRSINSVNTSQREDIFLKRSDVESNNKGSNNDKRLGFLFPEHKNHMNELLSSFSDENQELPATQRIGHSDAAEDSIAEMQSLNKKVVSNQIENPDENMNKVKRNSNKEQLSSGNCAISDEKNNATNEASLLKNSPVSKVIEHKESLKQCTKNKMLDKNVKPFAKDTFQSGDKYYSKASSQDKHKTKQLVESKETTVKKSQNNETNTKGPKSATKTSTNILKRDLNVLESPNTLQENSTKYENKKSSSQNENKKLFLPGKKTKVSTQSNNTQNDLSNDRTQPLSSDAFQKQKNLKDTSSFVADMKKEDLADDEIFPSTQNINSVLSSETSKKSNQSIHSELNYLQHGNSNTSVIDNGSKIDTSQRDDVVSQVKQNVTCVFNTHIKQEIVDDDYLPPTQAINISENIIQTSAEDASVKTTYVGSGFLIENAEDMNDLNKAFKPPNSTILQIKKEVLDEDCTVLSSVINCNVSIKREVLDDDIECIGVHQTSSNSNEATLKTTGADGCALTSNIPLPQFQLNMNIKKEVFSDDEDVIVSDDGEVECIGVLIKPKKKKRSFSKNLGEGGLIPGSDGCLSLAQVDLNIKKEPPSDKEKKCTEASNKSETPLKHSEIDVNIKKRDHLCNDKKECTEKNDQNRLALKYFEENGNASTDDGALSESVRKRKSVGTSPGTYVSKKGKVESSSSKQKEANNNKVSEKCIKKSENCVKYYSKESEKKHKHIQKNIQSNKRKFTEISSTLNCDANISSKTRNDCESDVSYVKDKSKNISSNERIRTSFDSDRGKRQCMEDVAQVEEVNRHTVTADNHKNTNTYLHKSKEVQKANIVQKSTNIHQENNSINGINHISDHKDRGFNKENPVQKSYNTKYNSHSATSKNHSKDPKECYSKDLKGEIIAEVKGVIEPFYSGGLITKEDYKDIMRKAEPKVDKKQVLKEQIAAEVKSVLKPFYSGGLISKEDYKDIMRRAVPKVFMNCGKIINPEKIKKLVLNYVSLLRNS